MAHIYEVQSDNELSKQIRLLKKTEGTFHVLFVNPSDPKSNFLLERFTHYQDPEAYAYTIPNDIILVDSFFCPSGFTLGSFHVTQTPTLVSFVFDESFGWSVSQNEWVSIIEEMLELV